MGTVQESLIRLRTLYAFSKKISVIHAVKHATTQRAILLEKLLEKIYCMITRYCSWSALFQIKFKNSMCR